VSPKNEHYGLQDMTFLLEEEVFPTVQAIDNSVVEKDNDDTSEKHNVKRKLPEVPTEKKVPYFPRLIFC